MKAVGVILIVLGLFAAASTASLNMQAENAGQPARERFLESVGGALCVLVLVVPGFFLALAGGKKGDKKYRPPPPRSPGSGREPDPAAPGTGQAAPPVAGTDGKVSLTCLACYADVRVVVPAGARVVDCPNCGHEIRADFS